MCDTIFAAKFYELKKQQARDGLALYRKFVVKMDRINEFMKVAKEVGVEREGEATELTRVCSCVPICLVCVYVTISLFASAAVCFARDFGKLRSDI